MFSGIMSRVGTLSIFPLIVAEFHSIQGYWSARPEPRLLVTTSSDFERSRMAMTSFNVTEYDGMFSTSPFTVTWQWVTN